MSRKPVIGVTAAFERARWAVWEDVEVNISQRTYTRRLEAAGGLPVLLPTGTVGVESPDQLLDLLDGLLLSGGADLDPAAYGAEPDPRTTNVRIERDRFEMALARAAIERDIPVLGVCRGFQVLNVALGGDLVQHLDDAEVHLHTPGQFSDHAVRLESGSLAAAAAGAERIDVRSHHHQGVGRLGEGLIATGWAEPGEAIEAVELPDRRWALGILWHTEEEETSAVIRTFCEAATRAEVDA